MQYGWYTRSGFCLEKIRSSLTTLPACLPTGATHIRRSDWDWDSNDVWWPLGSAVLVYRAARGKNRVKKTKDSIIDLVLDDYGSWEYRPRVSLAFIIAQPHVTAAIMMKCRNIYLLYISLYICFQNRHRGMWFAVLVLAFSSFKPWHDVQLCYSYIISTIHFRSIRDRERYFFFYSNTSTSCVRGVRPQSY